MRSLLQIFTLILSITTFAQNFKTAKITLIDDSQLSGLVFYNTPYQTPQSFRFKNSDTSQEKIYQKEDIKKITIENIGDFINANVEISRHEEAKTKISYNSKFNLQKENLILEVLVNGTNTLYKYSDEKNTAFFYSGSDNVIKPLLFNEYYSPNDDNSIIKNNKFRNDLQSIACENTSVNYINYSESDLLKFFKKTNQCAGDTNQTFKTNYGTNNLKILAANNFVKREYEIYDVKSSYTFGLEFERNMPFLNNSFSFAFTANYTTFDTDKEKTRVNDENIISQLDFSLLIRYYILNKTDYKIFVGVHAFSFSSCNCLTRTKFSGNPLEKNNISQLLALNNLEAGFRYKDFEVFGLLTVSQNYLQRNSASIGLKYNLPFIK